MIICVHPVTPTQSSRNTGTNTPPHDCKIRSLEVFCQVRKKHPPTGRGLFLSNCLLLSKAFQRPGFFNLASFRLKDENASSTHRDQESAVLCRPPVALLATQKTVGALLRPFFGGMPPPSGRWLDRCSRNDRPVFCGLAVEASSPKTAGGRIGQSG
jgi:hypothetical protein